MEYAKMTIKSDYRQRGDLVLRSYIRAMIKTLTPELLDINNDYEKLINYKGPYLCDIDKAYIYGIVDDNGVFYEIFTWQAIPYANYELISMEEFNDIISNFPFNKIEEIKNVIEEIVFDKNKKVDYSSQFIEELARDRAIEFEAYYNYLTNVNPYEEPLNGYNDFMYKCKSLRKTRGVKRER